MVIMGIDPGLANTGWGVVESRGTQCRARAYGCIHTGPQEVAVEEVFLCANTQSAIATAQARGAALVACSSCDLVIGEYTPMQIKQAVAGTGAAEKGQVQYMVKALLHLEQEPRPDHCADALAAAICHAHLGAWRRLSHEQNLARPAAGSYRERGTRL